jgi:signal transduction histidine kinase
MHMKGVDSEELVLGTVAKVLRRSERVINVKPGRVERDVVLDREKIAEVLTILLINAITHTAPQTEIDVSFEQVDSETVFSVADRGPGIPEDARERIFERFTQVEDVSHHSKPGIGLGLYIARTYVEAHNGWIKVEHRPGGGSIFSFAVPTTP